MCKEYLGIGHYITNPDTICYSVAKHQVCTRFRESSENSQAVKLNVYCCNKDCKDKALIAKTTSKMYGIIWHMEDEGHDTKNLASIIHIATAMATNLDSNSKEDSDAYERHGEMEERMPPAISVLNDKLTSEPPLFRD